MSKITQRNKRSRSNQSFQQDSLRHQSEIQRMQHETDQFTRKFEKQKKNLVALINQTNGLKRDIEDSKQRILKLRRQNENGKTKVLFTRMKATQKQIRAVDKRFNDVLGEIFQLKRCIQRLRQKRNRFNEKQNYLQQKILHIKQELQQIVYTNSKTMNQEINLQEDMVDQKVKNQKLKDQHYKQLKMLNSHLATEKRYSIPKLNPGQFVNTDTASILKARLVKTIVNNKCNIFQIEKVKLIDTYQKNMKAIDNAFNSIKESTGITDIQQIKNTFIKGQEQNYGLLAYVDILAQEIDNLSSQNAELRKKNQQNQNQNQNKKLERKKTPQELKIQRSFNEKISERSQKLAQFDQQLRQIEKPLGDLLIKFSKSKFQKNKYEFQAYKQGIILNKSTFQQYLSILQEYMNPLLINNSKVRGNKDIIKNMLLFDEMQGKDFQRKGHGHGLAPLDDQVPRNQLLQPQKLRQLAIQQLNRKPHKKR